MGKAFAKAIQKTIAKKISLLVGISINVILGEGCAFDDLSSIKLIIGNDEDGPGNSKKMTG